MAAMSEEFKMEKEAKDLNRRQLLFAAEEAEKEKSALRKKLMLAEAIIEKKVLLGWKSRFAAKRCHGLDFIKCDIASMLYILVVKKLIL